MAIFKNVSTEIGDVMLIVADAPIIGIVALQSFTDSTAGENPTNYFTKQFRYSVDGINYSPWLNLTTANLQQIQVQSNDTLYLQYAYINTGGSVVSPLTFNSVTVDGKFVTSPDGPVYQASNFAQFFIENNPCSVAWCINVLEKLYKTGILPNYISRDFSSNNADDRDFIDFWRSVTHYFALYVCLARTFKTFYTNEMLLLEYLTERGIIVTNGDEYQDLVYIMSSFYDEIRQRGTRKVFQPKGTVTPSGSKPVDGEFLRLLEYNVLDELIVNLNKNEHIGWNIGNSSPLYKGLEGRLNVNKYYCDYIDELNSVTELSIQTSSLPFVSIVHDPRIIDQPSLSMSESYSHSNSQSVQSFDRVIKIHAPAHGNLQGLGKGGKRIVINPNIDYEITFFVRSPKLTSTKPAITFGVDCFDKNGNIIQPLNISTLAVQNNFLTQASLNKGDQYYFVRGIIFGKNSYKSFNSLVSYEVGQVVKDAGNYYVCKVATQPGQDPISYPQYWSIRTSTEIQPNLVTNIGQGNNLVFSGNEVTLDPYILYSNINSSNLELYIYNIRVQPLSSSTSKGFVGITNFLELWSVSNQLQLSEQQIFDTLRKYLIPANVLPQLNLLPSTLS